MAIKKSDLYSSLWASCDELRGGMDASQYKDYVLFMLFIKYISDKYADSNEFAPAVVIPKGASFKDMVALKGKSDIGDRINWQIIQRLVEANSRLASSDFPNFNDPNKLGEGQAMVDRLDNLIGIFENPALDFSSNHAEHDDILGDAYEFLMRHFATESGKSKGQFYTPAEVSRIMAKVIGIRPWNAKASTTAYDPTCGSGSLLLKVAAEAGKRITLEGQEMDVTTAGLARMNMILHDFPTATILSGNTLAAPKFKDGEQLRTYDYVVANPPFSDKTWSIGLNPAADAHQRFAWGEPPRKQGDYAYLLHIVRSMKSTGKAACILPHGVLFRGNAEAAIRKRLILSGYLKGIIGLPANLFYGTGIPACILVLDKDNAGARRGIYMIDASRSFRKDGNKNRLREQDIHRIVDTFDKQADVPGYARMVGFDEIIDPKNDYNLNLPRYIDSAEPEDLQDIDGHLRGGIPARDLDALDRYWQVIPGVREALFESAGRPGYSALQLPLAEVKAAILGHPEFIAFNQLAYTRFEQWKQASAARLRSFGKDGHPKPLIEELSEDLLARFRDTPLLDGYDVYQHLMDYWAQAMQDDCYLIAADGWTVAAQPRLLVEDRNRKIKARPSIVQGRKKYLTELLPPELLIARYFAAEQAEIDRLEAVAATLQQQIDELIEEHCGEDGLLADALNDKGKLTRASATAMLDLALEDPASERTEATAALDSFLRLTQQEADTSDELKDRRNTLTDLVLAKYPALSEAEIQTLVIGDRWLATLANAVQGELDRVSQTLTGRIRLLAERYATPLPMLIDEVEKLSVRLDEHLRRMGRQASMPQQLPGDGRLSSLVDDWEVSTVGREFEITLGKMLDAEKNVGVPKPYIGNRAVQWGRIDISERQEMRMSPSDMERYRLRKGDLLVCEGGEVGRAAVWDAPAEECYFQKALHRLRPIRGFNPLLMVDLLRLWTMRGALANYVTQTSIAHLPREKFMEVPIHVPPVPEQTAIVSVLSDVDAELAALEARREKTLALKQAIMQELLTGRTRLV